MSAPQVCVIFNPRAGRGRAGRRLQRLRTLLGARALFQPTEGPGHGEELAFAAAQAGVPTVAAAGGDGTVHEVANGILRAGRQEVVLEPWPVGSANDYAHSLGLDPDWKLRGDSAITPRLVDAGLALAPDGRQRYFINGIGLGFNGHVNHEARHVRFLQGKWLYNLALLRALLLRFESPPMTVKIDGEERKGPTLLLSIALGRREGNFTVAADAVVDDGLFDCLHVGPVSRWELIRNLLRINTGKLPDHPQLWRGRGASLRIESAAPLAFHLDGELFSRSEDEVKALEVRLLPAALRVMANPQRGGFSQ
jgi:diacylglycerol kinase family enzyme